MVPRGDVAQLVERGLCKPEVVGSIPIVSTFEESVSPDVVDSGVIASQG
jgi:hypothetical protein